VDDRSEHTTALPPWALMSIDVAAVTVLFVVGVVEMRAAGDDIFFRSVDGLALVLVALQTFPAALRRVAPIPSLAVCVVAQATALFVGYPPTNAILAIPLALYSVASECSRRVTAAITIGSVVLFIPWELTDAPGTTQLVLLTGVIFGAAALAGDGSKARRLYAAAIEERARQDVERRETEMREAVVEERARIARELHDAVGHTVNVLVVHAGAGRVAAAHDPQRAAQALGEIESIGRAALTDIDRLLGLLREDGDAVRQPTQGLGDVPALVDRIRTTGVDVELTAPTLLPRVPVATGAAAYRIVQEALTNVIKHAGPAKVRVVVEVDGELRLTVEDDGRGAAAGPQPHDGRIGRGLIGMRERATLLGGELTAGPRPGGGYRVAARLPVPGSASDDPGSQVVAATTSAASETAP
jgi:signal transduction histidine kinase